MKAIATGNPLLIEQAEAEAELTRLERAHARAQVQLRWSIQASEREMAGASRLIVQAEAALARRLDTRGEAFAMVVQGEPITRRSEAEARLRAFLAGLLARGSAGGRPLEVGGLGGFTVTASADRGLDGRPAVVVRLEGVPESELRLSPRELAEASVVSRLEHRLAGLERLRDEAVRRLERAREELARAQDLVGKPFPQTERLAAARERVRAITEELERMASGAADGAQRLSERGST